jgi:hypothetical protein
VVAKNHAEQYHYWCQVEPGSTRTSGSMVLAGGGVEPRYQAVVVNQQPRQAWRYRTRRTNAAAMPSLPSPHQPSLLVSPANQAQCQGNQNAKCEPGRIMLPGTEPTAAYRGCKIEPAHVQSTVRRADSCCTVHASIICPVIRPVPEQNARCRTSV